MVGGFGQITEIIAPGNVSLPVLNDPVLRITVPVWGGCGITVLGKDGKPVINSVNCRLKKDPFTYLLHNWKVVLSVRTHISVDAKCEDNFFHLQLYKNEKYIKKLNS